MTDISAHYAPAGDWETPGADAWVLIATTDPDDPYATVTATVTATTIVYEPTGPDAAPPPPDLQVAAADYQLRLRLRRARAAAAAAAAPARDAR